MPNFFGGTPVNPSNTGYAQYTLSSTPTILFFPNVYTHPNANLLTQYVKITGTAPNQILKLPDATQVSVGYASLLEVEGTFPVIVQDYNGTEIVQLTPGQTTLPSAGTILVVDTSVPGGVWNFIPQLGSAFNVAEVAGLGLVALPNGPADVLTLNANTPVKVKTSNFIVDDNDRAALILMKSGTTISLPLTIEPDGFFFHVANATNNVVTVDGNGNLINGAGSLTISQGNSASLVSDGTNWAAYNLPPPNDFSFQNQTITTALSGTYGISENQLNNYSAFYFNGSLTGNLLVLVKPLMGAWAVHNNMVSGGFTFTIQMEDVANPGTGIGQSYEMTQGDSAYFILYPEDTPGLGPSLFRIQTNTGGGGAPFPSGTVSAPSINFADSLTSGFYLAASNPATVGLAVQGTPAMTVNYNNSGFNDINFSGNVELVQPGSYYYGQFAANDGTETDPSYTFTSSPTSGLYWDEEQEAIQITISGTIVGNINSDYTAFSPQIISSQAGTLAKPSFQIGSFATGFLRPAAGTIQVSSLGNPGPSFSAASGVTVPTGGITVTSGNVTVADGDIQVTGGDVQVNGPVQSNVAFIGPGGTAVAPAFNANSQGGMYSSTANTIDLAAGGNQILSLPATGNSAAPLPTRCGGTQATTTQQAWRNISGMNAPGQMVYGGTGGNPTILNNIGTLNGVGLGLMLGTNNLPSWGAKSILQIVTNEPVFGSGFAPGSIITPLSTTINKISTTSILLVSVNLMGFASNGSACGVGFTGDTKFFGYYGSTISSCSTLKRIVGIPAGAHTVTFSVVVDTQLPGNFNGTALGFPPFDSHIVIFEIGGY